jgi:uncharacterized membrane protein YdjX (TVP38/TMEM64 family)
VEMILVQDRIQSTSQDLRQRVVRLLPMLMVFLLLGLTYWVADQTGVMDLLLNGVQLKNQIQQLEHWGPIALVLLMAFAVVINPIPSAPIAMVAGALYGHTWGTLYVVIGAGSGAMIAFSIARLAGHELVKRMFGDRINFGCLCSQNVMLGMVFVSRLIPFLSFDLISYGAGLTALKFWRFAVATFAGLIPSSFLLAHFGGELAVSDLESGMSILLLLGGITLIPLAGKVVWDWRKSKSPVEETH